MSEKTEKATDYKLLKAKEKGQVSKSTELTGSLSLLMLLAMITALWPQVLHEIQALMRHLLQSASHFHFTVDTICHLQQFILSRLLTLWLPFALTGGLTIILGTIAQTGIIWSTTPLVPDFKRLNFAQGFKKLTSIKTCFDAAKSSLKLSLAVLGLFFILKHQLPDILHLLFIPPHQELELMMHYLLKIIFQLVLLLCLVSIIDKFYTRWKYGKDTRMSKQEIKEEHRQRDGDPKIKAKIRQLQNQLRQKAASLAQVKTADVIITNPVHLAIALQYKKETMPAPKVVCKACGDMVHQVKKMARKNGIPIIENKMFARSLYHSIELNQWISKDHYPLAASIFNEIYQQGKKS